MSTIFFKTYVAAKFQIVNTKQSGSVLNSELAYNILQRLARKTEGDYGKRIAEELGKPQASICRTLTNLTDAGFVTRGKRTRAQYYEINYEGITDFWYNSLLEELEEGENRDIMRKEEEIIKGIGSQFFEKVLTEDGFNKNITVSELLYNCLIYSVGEKLSTSNDFLDEKRVIRPITNATINKLDMNGFPTKLDSSIRDVYQNSDQG
jgi:DNA-binding transcriptional ArsR family regulator